MQIGLCICLPRSLGSPGGAAGGGELNFPASWTHRAPIVIQESRITNASTLTNFPVLLTAACLPDDFKDSDLFQADGGDIRFSADLAGAIPLACEVVSFAGNATPASATCEIWVKVPSVSPTVDTTFYVWRKSGVGETQPVVNHPTVGRNAVWSDYLCVFHGDDLTDATGNGNTLTANGGATVGSATAQIGKAFDLVRASSQYLSAGSAAMLDNLAEMTVQYWARNTLTPSIGKFAYPVVKTLPTGDTPWGIYCNDSYTMVWSPAGGNTSSGRLAAQNEWHLLAGGYGGSGASSATFWFDGMNANTFDRGVSPHDDAAGNFLIGWAEGGGGAALDYYNGQIDEVRLRAEFMSSDWLQADYETQANPALFSIPGVVTTL